MHKKELEKKKYYKNSQKPVHFTTKKKGRASMKIHGK